MRRSLSLLFFIRSSLMIFIMYSCTLHAFLSPLKPWSNGLYISFNVFQLIEFCWEMFNAWQGQTDWMKIKLFSTTFKSLTRAFFLLTCQNSVVYAIEIEVSAVSSILICCRTIDGWYKMVKETSLSKTQRYQLQGAVQNRFQVSAGAPVWGVITTKPDSK